MTEQVMRVFLRVAPDSRPSSIDLRPLEEHFGMVEPMSLTPDRRDLSVYFFEMPAETCEIQARRLINDLADQSSVDEVWESYLTFKDAVRPDTAKAEPKTSPFSERRPARQRQSQP